MTYGIKPEDVLPENKDYQIIDGVKVRKGTLGAVLKNASILSSSTATDMQKTAAKEIIKELSPALFVLGVYDHITWKNPEIQKIMEEAVFQMKKK